MARRRRPPRSGAISELPPLKIASQMAALQALYYAGAFGLVLFASLVSGMSFSLDLVFSWQAVRGDTAAGWLAGFLWLVDGALFMYVFFFFFRLRRLFFSLLLFVFPGCWRERGRESKI